MSAPICIRKHAFGKHKPFKDLYVSPWHHLYLEGKMVQARHLVNGGTIYQDGSRKPVEYYHVECDHHCILVANGILAESYLDLDNRSIFENKSNTHRKRHLTKLF
jgi:hypothetical protein